MDISEATVKAHMTAIFRKLGVSNRTQALLMLRDVTEIEG
jgi:DNA-binding NarL/FixJ family response regulator